MLGIRNKVARTARKAGLMTGGLLLCAVGTGFLTVAGWFALVPAVGVTVAALIIAGVYFGVGLILLGVASSGSDDRRTPKSVADEVPDAKEPAPVGSPLVQAFLYGLQAGSKAERAKR